MEKPPGHHPCKSRYDWSSPQVSGEGDITSLLSRPGRGTEDPQKLPPENTRGLGCVGLDISPSFITGKLCELGQII